MRENHDKMYFIEKLAHQMGNYSEVRNILKEFLEHLLKKGDFNCVFIYRKKKDKFELWEKKGSVEIPLNFKIDEEKLVNEDVVLNFKNIHMFCKKLPSFKKYDALLGYAVENSKENDKKEVIEVYLPLVEVIYQSITFNEKVQELLIKDDLTQLSNSRYFHLMVRKYSADKKYHPVTVIFLDLDDFKKINDMHGHLVGGKTLREVGRRLDVLFENFPGAVLTRYGGDEFTILLPNTDLEEGKAIAIMLRENFEMQSFEVPPHKFFITASFGVATFPFSTDDPDHLLSLADKAMFKVKGTGKNNVGVAYPENN